ncbi:MAG: tRNA pseudouridine(55) synthase TruB [Chloroflexi bacterium]|nr:tRNA pseudouridine(55) synthase TruB [Chloroflexota bacterium]
MHGFINIDKPTGITSHDVVARLRRITRIKRIGHAGTLDPAASGVLVVAIGQATRLIEYVQDDTHKTYDALIALGTATDSDDATGTVIHSAPLPQLDAHRLEQTLRQFVGTIQQVPPKVSAIHVDGQRMYDLARQGKAPELPSRQVIVYSLTLHSWSYSSITLTVRCGKGTYIRSLARDIGEALGTRAHLAGLRRTAVGEFTIDRALTLHDLTFEMIASHCVPPHHAIQHLPTHTLNTTDIQRIRNGLSVSHTSNLADDAEMMLCDNTGELVAIARYSQNRLLPHKVFVWSE